MERAALSRFVQIKTPDECAAQGGGTLPSFDPQVLLRHAPDEHWLLVNDDGAPSARASLWWKNAPPHAMHQLGIIGHFAATDARAGCELLQHAVARLAECGCTLAVGPMDGNTWRRYRLVTERGVEPPFFLDPDNPPDWPTHWTGAGFAPLASYFSALNPDLTREDPQVARAGERLSRLGVRLRPLNTADLEADLRRIYAVSARAFTANLLYTPLSEADFLAQYTALRDRMKPELTLLAELGGEVVGYVFTLPDWQQAARGEAVDTVIVKTVAVLPERRCAGLGAWLVAETQRAARALGYRRAIHALMHESNNSLNLSGRYATPFRRYTLFGKELR